MEQDHKRERAGPSGSGKIGFGIRTGSGKDKTGGDTGGSVAERFNGYRLGGVTSSEVENTKNGEDELKRQARASTTVSKPLVFH